MVDEFGLIARYFTPLGQQRADIVRGIGDDAAIILMPAGQRLVVAVDTLTEGRHFPLSMAAESVGTRAVAVNLSDLAAMAATPRYATLALTLPTLDEAWLEGFSRGFGQALKAADCALIGGDTTCGPLTITIQMIGVLDGPALTRDAAQVGDLVAVSGTVGDARAALDLLQSDSRDPHSTYLLERYQRPSARIALAQAIAGHAHAAIDISDGLLADAGHIAEASAVAIEIELANLPLSPALIEHCDRATAQQYAACGGDDYELLFTFRPAHRERILATAHACSVPVTVIGRVKRGRGVTCYGDDGNEVLFERTGFQHFR